MPVRDLALAADIRESEVEDVVLLLKGIYKMVNDSNYVSVGIGTIWPPTPEIKIGADGKQFVDGLSHVPTKKIVEVLSVREIRQRLARPPMIKKSMVIRKSYCSVCDESPGGLCYAIRWLKNKKKPQRFQIILLLQREKIGGKSAASLATAFGKETKSARENIKNEIGEINARFREELEMEDDLIVMYKTGGKNMYSLNREVFNFRIE